MADITPARKLFDLLISRDFDPEMLDSSGRPAPNPAEAEIFSFDFRAHSGKDYGTVVIMIGNDNDLEIYCSDNVGRGMEGDDKNDWFAFLEQLKNFATRNFMSFGIKNLNRLRYSMQGQAAIKEGLFESWTGNRTTSWNGAPTEARLMIRHKKTIGEGDARFRHIESLFIETADSERYKLPFTSLTAGRAMLEHVRQGGRPYDPRGNHICEMVTELSVLSRFRRANTGQIFEGDTATLVEQVQEYQANLQRSLKGLGTRTGYTKYFESWSPAEISEQDVVIESLKSLFVKQSIDTRIESALPLLAKIQQQGTAMKEANIFEAWAERLVEGTWQLPDTPEKQAQLLELMSTDLPVGADATNATEQLYDVLGDDELFDQLEQLAERDANADARQVIYDRMQMLSDHPDVLKVIEQLQIDPTAEMNPPEATPADLTESRLLDEDGSKLEHILDRFKHEVRNFEQGGDLDDNLYDALFDYWFNLGDIPYGVAKARTGDPYEWVANNLESHLRGGGIVGGNPDEDYALERESVDMVDEFKDPMTQTEDPAGTLQPTYPEYQDPLVGILKTAGVPAQERPAPDYETGVTDEGILGTLGGAAIGALTPIPGGATLGSIAGDAIQDKLNSEEQLDEVTPDEMAQAEWLKDPKNREANRYQSAIAQRDTQQQLTTKASLDYQTKNNLNNAVKQYKDAVRDIEHKRQMGQVTGNLAGAAAGTPGSGGSTNVSDAMGQQITDIIQKAQNGQMDANQAIAFINKQTQQITGKPVASQPASVAAEDASPLAGKYGHSGKMKEVGKDTSFLDRLKELSGMSKK